LLRPSTFETPKTNSCCESYSMALAKSKTAQKHVGPKEYVYATKHLRTFIRVVDLLIS
jgi:hypothetical protein